MAGASESHNLIVTNSVRELSIQLKGRDRRVYSNDMRVDLREREMFAYPDVVVVCGEPQFADEGRENLRNPVVIIEVLSPSTESYDRGVKFFKYRRIESLKEYLLVAQDGALIEHYVRQANGDWLMSEAMALDAIVGLDSIGCALTLGEVYDKVRFTA
jgi:Uma2 family endonuclease